MDSKRAVSCAWASAAILAASLEPVVAKLGYLAQITPLQLLLVKSCIGALVILPLTRNLRWVGLSGLRSMLVVSLLLFATSSLTLLSLQTLSAVTVITLLTWTPAPVALANQFLGRDILGTRFWIGFVLCTTGALLALDLKQLSFNWIGIVEILAAVLTSTIYRVRLETVTAKFAPSLVSSYIFLLNGSVALSMMAAFSIPATMAAWTIGSWLGLAAAAANVAFLYAISLMGSTRVSIITMLERPAILLLAAVVLHEQLTPAKIISITLVMAGVQIATVKRRSLLPEATADSHSASELAASN